MGKITYAHLTSKWQKLSLLKFVTLIFSHPVVGGAAAALGADPVDVLAGVLDVARLAVDAVLGVDHQLHPIDVLPGHVLVHPLKNKNFF